MYNFASKWLPATGLLSAFCICIRVKVTKPGQTRIHCTCTVCPGFWQSLVTMELDHNFTCCDTCTRLFPKLLVNKFKEDHIIGFCYLLFPFIFIQCAIEFMEFITTQTDVNKRGKKKNASPQHHSQSQ